jgi:hypothetical protein
MVVVTRTVVIAVVDVSGEVGLPYALVERAGDGHVVRCYVMVTHEAHFSRLSDDDLRIWFV